MAGGNFNLNKGKDRPGVYANFESTRQEPIVISDRGIVLLPLFGHDYGPAGEFITIDSDSPDANITKLGYNVGDPDHLGMLLIREAFKNARRVIVYIPSQGAASTVTYSGFTATARYGGARGNDLTIAVIANPLGGFDVTVFLGAEIVSHYEGLETFEELIAQNDPWVIITGTGALQPTSGMTLAGGANGALVAADITDFLDKSELVRWNVLAFPLEPTGETGDPVPALQSAVLAKIKYLREDTGKYRKAVLADFDADYEGIINVTNSVVLASGVELTTGQATAWVAGVDAGATNVQSNTHVPYQGAVSVANSKNHGESIQAIRNSEFFFSVSEEGEVIVEYDINSLKDFSFPKDKTWRKNRVLRVFDTFAESLTRRFKPNKFDNTPTGWEVMEGLGRGLLLTFLDDGAIINVDFDADFLVDRTISKDDETYFNVGLQAADSSEKLFFTIRTR